MVFVGQWGAGYPKKTRVDRLQLSVEIALAIHQFRLISELVIERLIELLDFGGASGSAAIVLSGFAEKTRTFNSGPRAQAERVAIDVAKRS